MTSPFKLFLTVQNSQNSLNTSNPTVAKLLEVDAELAIQEVELSAQLQSLQEKRHSLKTVIDLFVPIDTGTATPIATTAQTQVSEEKVQPTVQDLVLSESDGSKSDTNTEAKKQAVPDTQKRQAKNLSPANNKQSASVPTKKISKELDWQQYVRGEFSNTSLAQAVSEVMQQQSEQILEIAAIVDAIFVDEIPQGVRSRARERVSNVLSVGVKKEKWYRGEVGSYSMSKVAVRG